MRTIYREVGPGGGEMRHVALRRDGLVMGDPPFGGLAWEGGPDSLRLRDPDGNLFANLRPGLGGDWIGSLACGSAPVILEVALSTSGQPEGPPDLPAFLVNSVPKAGTYFMEAALNRIGCPSLRLHLIGSGYADDYRGVPETVMHADPLRHRLTLPVRLIADLLRHQHVVGHVDSPPTIDYFEAAGVPVLTLVRNLRDVLVSLYRFKLNRVTPRGMLDHYWRGLDEGVRFTGFLMHYHLGDLLNIRRMAELALIRQSPLTFRFEDMRAGRISPQAAQALEELRPGLSGVLCAALESSRNQASPTWSGGGSYVRPDGRPLWNADAERYFRQSGMQMLNEALGYEQV